MLDYRKCKRIPEKNTYCFIDYAKAFDCMDHNKLWEILRDMGTPDHLTCSWEICMQVRKQVRTGHGPTNWFQIRKGACQGCILSPCLFNLYAEYSMWNAGLDEAQAGIKIDRRNTNNLRYAGDTTLMAESEELKRLLIEESEKVGLKLNIQKTKIMASGPVTSWQTDGETVESVTDFIFGVLQITGGGDCSHEIKRCLLLGRKSMNNLDSILKSRDITLPTEVHLVKAMVFPVVMYGCESWPTQKAECWRTDAFELWCWRGLLRVPWTARRFNQSILTEIILNIHWKDWCWSWNSNTLTTWCREQTHLKRSWCSERVKAGGDGQDRQWDGWMASWTRRTWVWASFGSW